MSPNVIPGPWLQKFMTTACPHVGHAVVDTDCLLGCLLADIGRPELRALQDQLSNLDVDPAQLALKVTEVRPPTVRLGEVKRHTARLRAVLIAAPEHASLASTPGRLVTVEPIDLFAAVLRLPGGPAHLALSAAGVDLPAARRAMQLSPIGSLRVDPIYSQVRSSETDDSEEPVELTFAVCSGQQPAVEIRVVDGEIAIRTVAGEEMTLTAEESQLLSIVVAECRNQIEVDQAIGFVQSP